jgi:hypothetical protein
MKWIVIQEHRRGQRSSQLPWALIGSASLQSSKGFQGSSTEESYRVL